MPPLLTIVFTDVVESSATKRDTSLGRDSRERDHAYLEKVQSPHFTLIRGCSKAHGGREVSTMGDAFYLIFEDPVEAVRCAVDIQRQLTAHPIETPRGPLRLRIGIHSGYPEWFEKSYHGTDVDKAARVEAMATAQQILLSATTYELVQHMTDVKFYSKGDFVLKGVDRVVLWEVAWDSAGARPTATPALSVLRRKKLSLIATGVATLILGVFVVSWLLMHYGKIGSVKTGARRSVAILGFRNLTGKPTDDWMSTSLSEMLTTELAAGEQLYTLPGEDVTRAKLDLNFPESESLSEKTLGQLRDRLGSDMVVMGSYYDMKGLVRIDVRLQDAKAGGTIANFSETGTEAEFLAMVSRIGSALRAHCGVRDLTPTQSASLRASLPANPEAAQLYAQGLERLREFDPAAARDKFEAMVVADPNDALAHSALSSAWSELGYDAKAVEEAKNAFDLSQNLSREDRLSIEGSYYVADKQWDKAIEAYRNLFGFFPDNLEYGLDLAEVQTSGGKAQDALATINKVRQEIPQHAGDPRIDLGEARAAIALSDYPRAETAAGHAAAAAIRQGARLERGQALLQRCWAFRNLGRFEDAKRAGQQAREAFADTRYARGQARSLTCVADVLDDQGDLVTAEKMQEMALSLAQSIGARMDIAGALNNLGNVLSERGKLEESNAKYQAAVSVAREIGDRADEMKAQSNIGNNLIMLGQFSDAQNALESSLAIAQAIGEQQGVAASLINLGLVSYSVGDLAKSEQRLNEALSLSRLLGLRADTSFALVAFGDLMLAEDKLDAAENDYRESLQISKELNEKDAIAATQLSMALLALERGDLANAETIIQETAQETHALGNSEREMFAHSLLARTFALQGKIDAARAELKMAAQLAAKNEPSRLTWLITEGRLLAREGKKSQATSAFLQALERARKMGYIPGQFEARLALLEIEDSGRRSRDTISLARDATHLRFYLVARRTGEIADRPTLGAVSVPRKPPLKSASKALLDANRRVSYRERGVLVRLNVQGNSLSLGDFVIARFKVRK
jgi:class 3 adenylate cyclase/tetratricopeptide (TPR) repeat protein/TolB-like protein